jgi:predicted esterase
MAFALIARVGLLGVVCALALGCSDDGGAIDMTATTAGSGGVGGDASAGGGSAGTITGTAGTATTAGSGGVSAGGSAGASTSGGMAGLGGMAGMAGVGGMIDANGGAPAGVASGRHTARPVGSFKGNTAGYYEYVPPHYGNGARYPLLVFRHGVGENGNGTTDLDKILVHGPPKLIKANQWPEDRKFVVLSVQHPGAGCPTPQEMDDFFTFAVANYDIDPKRIYLTGLSCGSIGSWNYLGDHVNEDVAAAVLICGDGRPAFQKAGCNLGKVPIWAFHGEADDQVDPKGSIETIASLKACTNPAPVDVKLTTYPGVGHDSWTMTYNLSNPANDIYAWLMTHEKQ